MKQKVIVIGHGYTSRLAVVRSVAQIGCEVTLVVMTGYRRFGKKLNTCKPIDGYSKYVSRILYCNMKDGEGLVKLLLNKCTDPNQKVVIIPDSDFSAAVIDRYQEQLRSHFLYPHIHHTPGAIVACMDKIRQKELARQVGLNVAGASVVEVTNHQYSIPSTISYPCFTKPLATIEGGKRFLHRCDNESELRSVLDIASCIGNLKILVEDYKIIDTEYAVLGFSDGNEVVIPGILQIIIMSHGGHFGVASQGMVMPVTGFEELIAKFKQFILQIGYVGLFDIDFYECGNILYFGELNLRFGGSGYAVTKMGVNLPGMFVKTLCGESIADMQKTITSSATYVNERMCMDDWYKGYMPTNKYNKIISSSDIRFVADVEDEGPQFAFNKEFRLLWIKRLVKKCLKKCLKGQMPNNSI
ncbi:MAG: hypothetical protein J5486_11145 [Bacteroidaceae bacterium]|nr:hypothetical protein [Bacteroidaceae bacterium]